MPTSTVAITLDMGCCRCRSKIHKILCCLQERCGFIFDKVEYSKDKVLVSGPFDAIDLCCKLRCKAGCFAIKIDIVPQPEPKKNKEPTSTPIPIPTPTPTPTPTPPPVKDRKTKREPETCKALIPYPYPCPYPYPYPSPSPCPNPQPTCPSSCATPLRSCQCNSCRLPPCPPPPPPCLPPPPPPPSLPPPPPPPPCPPLVCNKCPTWTPCQCRGYPWVVCCDEKQPDPCSLM